MNHSLQRVRAQKKLSFFAQTGFSSLLFILLVGVSMTALTVGYMSSMRSLQSSSITAHAQTQAQINAMIGSQALVQFLQGKSSTDLDQIDNGTVTKTDNSVVSSYKKVATCPGASVSGAINYCFDVLGKSGGATATIRGIYQWISASGSNTLEGSIFAGGLRVNDSSTTFRAADNSSINIFTGGDYSGNIVNMNNNVLSTNGQYNGINVKAYIKPVAVMGAAALKSQANYIFTHDSNGVSCYKNNLYSGGSPILGQEKFSCTDLLKITINNKLVSVVDYDKSAKKWVFYASDAKLAGVIWFDGDVLLQLKAPPSTATSTDVAAAQLVNSVISTGMITTAQMSGGTVYDAFAPNYYLLNASDANIKDRYNRVCPTDNYPLQYCVPVSQADRDKITSKSYFYQNETTYLKNMTIFPANIANILLSADTGFSINVNPNTKLNLYGNLVGSASGGTGSASGKITGTGDINVQGNFVVTGAVETDVTGRMTVVLGGTTAEGNSIPSFNYVVALKTIRYM